MQRLFIAGRVGKDAELRQTQGGDPVLGFTVAVDNGKDKPATWYDAAILIRAYDAVGFKLKYPLASAIFGYEYVTETGIRSPRGSKTSECRRRFVPFRR